MSAILPPLPYRPNASDPAASDPRADSRPHVDSPAGPDRASGRVVGGRLSQVSPEKVATELVAVIVAVSANDPRILTIGETDEEAGGSSSADLPHGGGETGGRRSDDGGTLPAGPLESGHRSLQAGLRAWVERQARHALGYVEQLYTFADRDRRSDGRRVISISYLGLTTERPTADAHGVWRGWYEYFPWEDHREGRPAILDSWIAPMLLAWAGDRGSPELERLRRRRAETAFGLAGHAWNEDLILQRYEMLYEAGLVAEAQFATASAAHYPEPAGGHDERALGRSMRYDHRRILATGVARLRAKIKYRPVIFELMPAEFTLLQLQRAVEALAGRGLHKQNFRRLVEQQDLIEDANRTTAETGGRPARLYRFRREILLEREVSGSKLPLSRS
jgi:hypothetical protein